MLFTLRTPTFIFCVLGLGFFEVRSHDYVVHWYTGCTRIHYTDQDGLKLTDAFTSDSWVLILKICATQLRTPTFNISQCDSIFLWITVSLFHLIPWVRNNFSIPNIYICYTLTTIIIDFLISLVSRSSFYSCHLLLINSPRNWGLSPPCTALSYSPWMVLQSLINVEIWTQQWISKQQMGRAVLYLQNKCACTDWCEHWGHISLWQWSERFFLLFL